MTSGNRQAKVAAGLTEKKNPDQAMVFRGTFETGQDAKVILLDRGTQSVVSEEPFVQVPFNGNVRQAVVRDADPAVTDYVFCVDGNIEVDPRAKLVRGREHFGSMERRTKYQVRASFPADDFAWGDAEKAPMIPYEQVVAYCLHVRGFTRHDSQKTPDRGTFQALERKTEYLQGLGINQIILMPCYEFEEIEERRRALPAYAAHRKGEVPADRKLNYWGFAKSWYFAPKAGYCATSEPDREFKSMVKAMHAAGIEVIMEFAFFDDVPEDLALDALRWWTAQYHVDGFLLYCRPALALMAAHDAFLAKSKLISGYFDPAAAYPHGRGNNPRVLASCNDGFKFDMRRSLKGDADRMASFVERSRQDGEDVACVNYMTAHDGFTMMDLVSYDCKHNEENGESGQDGAESEFSWNCGMEGPTRKRQIRELRLRQIKNAFAMLLLSRGTPMILAGDEMGNSQGGNSNPYCLDSPVTWVEWNSRKMSREIYDFVRELIAFRKAHPILTKSDSGAGKVQITCGYPHFSCHSDRAWFGAFDYQARHVGLMYCGVEDGRETFIYAAYNFHWDPQSFALPYLPEGLSWKTAIDTGTDAAGDQEIRKEFTLPGRTVRVLISAPSGPAEG